MSPEICLTPPLLARRRIAGLVMPWMLSLSTLRWRLAPPFPSPFPPLPRPVMMLVYQKLMIALPSSSLVPNSRANRHPDQVNPARTRVKLPTPPPECCQLLTRFTHPTPKLKPFFNVLARNSPHSLQLSVSSGRFEKKNKKFFISSRPKLFAGGRS